MSFDLEDKIRFEELAPSLQKLFTSNSNFKSQYDKLLSEGENGQIVKINGDKTGIIANDDFVPIKVVNTPEELETQQNIEPISLYTVINEWMKFWFCYGPANHVADYTNWSRYGPYEFAAKPYRYIYNKGYTFASRNSSVRNDRQYALQYQDHQYDNAYTNFACVDTQWGLIQGNGQQAIYQCNDNESCAGFINPTNYYTDYLMDLFCYVGWDDDNLMFYVGFMKDSNNVMHSLSFTRGAGYIGGWSHSDCRMFWCLVYDMGKDTMCILRDFTDTIGVQSSGSDENYGAFMRIERHKTKLKGMTTNFQHWGSTYFDPNNKDSIPFRTDAIIEWEYPNTYEEAQATIQTQTSMTNYFSSLMGHSNYSAFTREAYENIGIMLNKSNRMGFGARSGTPYFSIIYQTGFMESQHIVDVLNNAVYAYIYDSSTHSYEWKYIGTLDQAGIPHKVWLYNMDLQTLYWYDRPGVYIKLTSDNAQAPASLAGQLAKDGSNVITASDNFYQCAAVDNSTDFSNQQFDSAEPIYNLTNNIVYAYNGSGWQTTGKVSDLLVPYIYLYNSTLHRFFFYRGVKSDGTLDYDRIKLL